VGVVFAGRTYQLGRQGQITDRYTKAIGQLGDDKLEIRLGGIYALERIAVDSHRDHSTIVEVLSAYGRECRPVDLTVYTAAIEGKETLIPLGTDVQAALTVLGRLPRRDLPRAHLQKVNLAGVNLESADLVGADLAGADLTQARLVNADLTGADLNHATLTRARFDAATLVGANLTAAVATRARLTNVDLTDATLLGADLEGVNLTGATLVGADLAGVKLSGADLSGTKANMTTRLSPEQIRPPRWTSGRRFKWLTRRHADQ